MIVNPEPVDSRAIGRYYDHFHPLYELIWGQHLHHGYWDHPTQSTQRAITNLLDLAADWLRPTPKHRLLDVGCGYGASGRYLNQRFGCHVAGYTVSEQQYNLGKPLTESGKTSIFLEDWMKQHNPKRAFDGMVSLECLCHISHKSQFFQNVSASLKPGARAVLTFLTGNLEAARWYRLPLLKSICRYAMFPSLIELGEENRWIDQAELDVVASENITSHIMPTWSAIFSRAVTRYPKAWITDSSIPAPGRAELGLTVNAIRLLTAYRLGALQYRLLVLEKP